MQSSNKQTKQIPISRPRWCSRRLLRLLLRFMVRRTLITPLRVVTAHPPRLVMSRKQRILAADNLRMVDNLLRHVRLNTVAAWGNPIIHGGRLGQSNNQVGRDSWFGSSAHPAYASRPWPGQIWCCACQPPPNSRRSAATLATQRAPILRADLI